MSSTNKTSLGLNMWEASDKPVRQDFVNDNVIIDEKITKLNSDLAILYTPTVAVDLNLPQSIICFSGNNTLNSPYKNGLTSASEGICISLRTSDKWNSQLYIVNGIGMYRRYVGDTGESWKEWTQV